MSREGSMRAVQSIVQSAANFVADGHPVDAIGAETFHTWFGVAAWHLQVEADADVRPVRDYACTLLVAVIDEQTAAYAQLGDGAIVAGCGDDVVPIFWPQQGEFANTTFFITAPEHLSRVQTLTGSEVPERVAVISDGLQNLALRNSDRTAHPGFFSPLFHSLRTQPEGKAEELQTPLEAFLGSQMINARTDDDKSLLLAIRALPQQEADASFSHESERTHMIDDASGSDLSSEHEQVA